MTRLRYIGPLSFPRPAPEGWKADDHEEPDATIAAAKLAYRTDRGEPLWSEVKTAKAAKEGE